MTKSASALDSLIGRLSSFAELEACDRSAINGLPREVRKIARRDQLIREGDRGETCYVLLSGVAAEGRVVDGSKKQIMALHLPGDLVNLEVSLFPRPDHRVQALTQVEAAFLSSAAILDLAFARPRIGRALLAASFTASAIARQWMASVGRRDARMRLAHLICELAVRLKAAGVSRGGRFRMPLSRDDIADVLSLHPVCVSRVMQSLRDDGLISAEGRSIIVEDWSGLTRAGGFRPAYLHGPVRRLRAEFPAELAHAA